MKPTPLESNWREVDQYVEAYEQAALRSVGAELSAFLPDPHDARYAEVLQELVRVDLELRWQRGCPRKLDDYLAEWGPPLLAPEVLRQIAFEEFRARRQAGEMVAPAEYERRYGVTTQGWSHDVGPPQAADFSAAPKFPGAGETYLGFELLEELGRGAFSRVFLARQGDLANRRVVLKVSTSSLDEADKLAQLQHAHIVSIYSVHQEGPLRAVCMPYFGATTLADVLSRVQRQGQLPASGLALLNTLSGRRDVTWLAASSQAAANDMAASGTDETNRLAMRSPTASDRQPELKTLRGLSYVEAVLWIGARLAAGLEHAHQRGIVHRDLKPANVLLADDGRPMLLDFNLSEDIKRVGPASEPVVGGTLPYMASEQIAAFQARRTSVDPRSDVFALGVILYELLSGRPPFPLREGPLESRLMESLADRRQGAAPLPATPGVTPAVRAIVARCLTPAVDDRYPSAEALREDLQRQLDHRPLQHAADRSPLERGRKWLRRHPSATSAGGMAAAALVALAVLAGGYAVRGRRLQQLDAQAGFQRHQQELLAARTGALLAASEGGRRIDEAIDSCRAALDRYGAATNDRWQALPAVQRLAPQEKTELTASVDELRTLTAALDRLAASADRREPPAVPAPLAGRFLANEESTAGSSPTAIAACQLSLARRWREALPIWQRAVQEQPRQVWVWYGLANCQLQLGQTARAVASLTACIALEPEFAEGYFQRGAALLGAKDYAAALIDFGRALELRPERNDALVNRALALLGENCEAEAVACLNTALAREPQRSRWYFIRARAHDRLQDREGAARDRRTALETPPRDEQDWTALGVEQLAGDPAAALESFRAAVRLNPYSLPARENCAHVLSERLGRAEEAVEVLDDAARVFPDNALLIATRGVLQARLGRREAAIQDAERALRIGESEVVQYHVAGVYAQTAQQHPEDRLVAVALLASALRRGYGAELLERDDDLHPLHNDAEFQALVQAVRTLQAPVAASSAAPSALPKASGQGSTTTGS